MLHAAASRGATGYAPLQGLLYPRWQQLVTRNAEGMVDPRGKVWGVPYRWGCTVIAYNEQKLRK